MGTPDTTTFSHHHHPGANHLERTIRFLWPLFLVTYVQHRGRAIMTVAAQKSAKSHCQKALNVHDRPVGCPQRVLHTRSRYMEVLLWMILSMVLWACTRYHRSLVTSGKSKIRALSQLPVACPPRKSHRCTLLRGALTTVLSSKVRVLSHS